MQAFPGHKNPLGWEPKGTAPMAIKVVQKKKKPELPRVVTQLTRMKGAELAQQKNQLVLQQEGQDFHCCILLKCLEDRYYTSSSRKPSACYLEESDTAPLV